MGLVKPKTILLTAQIKLGEPNSKTQVTTWAIQNGQVILKMFFSQELSKHNDLKFQNCGIFLHETIDMLLYQ